MRVLAVTTPAYGHFHPMLPMARALTASDHDVLFVTSADFAPRVEAAGFEVQTAGISGEEAGAQVRQRFPDLADIAPEEGWRRGLRMFAAVIAPSAAPALIGIAGDWKPDLVLFESAAFAGPLVAAKIGVPSVEQSFGRLRQKQWQDLAYELLVPLWQEHGLDSRPRAEMYKYLYLDICPPSLQSERVRDIATARPTMPVPIDSAGESLPDWIDALPNERTIYVTLGTVFNKDVSLFSKIIEAAQGLSANVIVTIGNSGDPEALGPQPPNVFIERYIPQSLLFDRCDLVVSHGGSGTMLAALGHGIPLLMLPQGADQFRNSLACDRAGVSLSLEPDEQQTDGIKGCIEQLLADVSFRQSAMRIKAEIAAMPEPAVLVPVLEGVARQGATEKKQ
ncbi:MAG: glycosyltransferase [Actinomycetota bacterium]